jgi:hypothetical protein
MTKVICSGGPKGSLEVTVVGDCKVLSKSLQI